LVHFGLLTSCRVATWPCQLRFEGSRLTVLAEQGQEKEGGNMHLLVIGAAGMIGRKVADAVAASGRLGDRDVSRLTLADTVKPEIPNAFSGEGASLALDIADPRAAHQLVVGRPDVIIHLAAIVSGEAELISTRATRSISMGPVISLTRSGISRPPKPIARGWSSPRLRSRCLARRCPI
jgi:hypothetical protein